MIHSRWQLGLIMREPKAVKLSSAGDGIGYNVLAANDNRVRQNGVPHCAGTGWMWDSI